jgi:glycine betaine/proline transport system permease protein
MSTKAAISVGRYVAEFVDWLNVHFSADFSAVATSIEACVRSLENALLYPSAPFVMIVWGALAWRLAGLMPALLTFLGLGFCWVLNLWPETMLTMALVLVSVIGALALAIPLGILAARSNFVDRTVHPLLDIMQTMPPWVYLIPAVILFGLGRAPAVFATMIFAMPPPLRLTNLGIRQVLVERKELGEACGATPMQILLKIEIPSALPAIMVGVNQCIMLALSMVVLAGLIGAGGLGGEVTRGLTRMMLGVGTRAGLAIVILAIMFDRISQGAVRRLSKTVDEVNS